MNENSEKITYIRVHSRLEVLISSHSFLDGQDRLLNVRVGHFNCGSCGIRDLLCFCYNHAKTLTKSRFAKGEGEVDKESWVR